MKKIIITLFVFLNSIVYAQPLTSLISVYQSESGYGSCITTDNSGNIFYAGKISNNSISSAGDTIYNQGMFLTKTNSSGTEIWRVNNITGSHITPRSIMIDNAGSIYVLGNFYNILTAGTTTFSTGSSTIRRFFIAKYSSTGSLLWIKAAGSNEFFICDAELENNNLFIVGGIQGTATYQGNTLISNGSTDMCILKLDTSGAVLNKKNFGGIGEDFIYDIEADNSGNLFVCGAYSASFLAGGATFFSHAYLDGFLMKLDSSITPVWAATAGSLYNDAFRGMAIDSSGAIYVTGYGGGYNFSIDGSSVILPNDESSFLLKYSSTGVCLKGVDILYWGNTTSIDLVNHQPVVSGQCWGNGGSHFYDDASIPVNYWRDGFYALYDTSLLTKSIGKISGSPYDFSKERCLRVCRYDNESFLITGYGGKDIEMPDTVFNGTIDQYDNWQNRGGSAFLQKIYVPHLTVTPSDSIIIPPIYSYSSSYPLEFLFNLNGNTLLFNNSNVKLGYSKSDSNNYSYFSLGNYQSGIVTAIPSIGNPPLSNINYYRLNFNFNNRNLMIRSENKLKIVTCFSLPAISGPSIICEGDTAILTASSAYSNYSWSPSSQIVSTNNNIAIVAPVSNTTYTAIAYSGATCYTTSKIVNVNIQSGAYITLTNTNGNNCSPISLSFQAVNISTASSNIAFYRNGVLQYYTSGSSGVFNVTQTGSYYVVANSGCGWSVVSDTVTINSIAGPIATPIIQLQGTSYMCAGDTQMIYITNYTSGLDISWLKNGIVISGAVNDTLYVSDPGNYQARFSNSCYTTTSAYMYIYLSTLLNYYVYCNGATNACLGNVVQLNSSYYCSNCNGTVTLQWLKNGIPISGAYSSGYAATTSGNYRVRYYMSTCGYFYTNVITVSIDNPVVASVTYTGSLNLCNGQSIQLTASPGADYVYQWRLNGNDISGETNQTFIASQAGSYTCFISNFCNAVLSNAAIVSTAPDLPDSITVLGNLNICPGQSVTFTAPYQSGVNYQWFRDGNPINGATGNSYLTSIGGVYTCRFNNLCGTVFSNQLTLSTFNLSNSIFAPNGVSLCSGDSVYLLTNSNPQLTYQWQWNGVNISGATNNFYYALQPGNYNCVFVNAVCGTFLSPAITITPLQFSSLVVSSPQGNTLCSGTTLSLSVPSGLGFTYQWLLNNVPLSGATNSNYTASQAGNFSCILNASCLSDTTNTAVISNGPAIPSISISISGNDTICSGDSAMIVSFSTNATSYQWKFNGADISGATNSNYEAFAQGQYSCTASNYCGSSNSGVLQLTSITAPATAVSVFGDTVICAGQSAVISADMNLAFDYQWYLNGAAISGATNNQIVATVQGNYYCIINSDCGLYYTDAVHITVLALPPPPSISIAGNLLTCTTNAYSYQWFLNGNPVIGAIFQNYQPLLSGSYSVAVYNQQGCSSFATPVNFNSQSYAPVTSFQFSSNSICRNQCIQFNDNSSNNPNSWNWSFPGGSPASSTLPNPFVCYNQPGNYNVQLITANPYGFDTLLMQQIVAVNPIPSAIIIQSHDTLFTAQGMAQYQWTLNGVSIPGASNYFYVVVATGSYKVFLTNNSGCSDSTQVGNYVLAKPEAGFTISDNEICEGDCVSFTDQSSNTPLSWHWILPGTANGNSTAHNPSACYTTAGDYDVTLISTNATGSDTLVLNSFVHVYPPPPLPVISQSGNILTSTPGASYQWYLNGQVIAGAVYQQIFVTTPGNYKVKVWDSIGCSSLSALLAWTQVGNVDELSQSVSVFPNPADDEIQILINQNSEIEHPEIKLLNMIGQQVEANAVKNDFNSFTISTESLASGSYWLLITDTKIRSTVKIIVIH